MYIREKYENRNISEISYERPNRDSFKFNFKAKTFIEEF